jgi:hypothetical protein
VRYSQWVKAREGQPLLTSVTMLRWKYDILLDRPLHGKKVKPGKDGILHLPGDFAGGTVMVEGGR